MAVNIQIVVFWAVISCTDLPEEHVATIIPEDDGNMFLRKVCICLQDYAVS
jgi:hypothetical protein